jgi:vacuolar-type H+-ATPase subunit E/Vma4
MPYTRVIELDGKIISEEMVGGISICRVDGKMVYDKTFDQVVRDINEKLFLKNIDNAGRNLLRGSTKNVTP